MKKEIGIVVLLLCVTLSYANASNLNNPHRSKYTTEVYNIHEQRGGYREYGRDNYYGRYRTTEHYRQLEYRVAYPEPRYYEPHYYNRCHRRYDRRHFCL